MTMRAGIRLAAVSVAFAVSAAGLAEQGAQMSPDRLAAHHDDNYEYRLPYGDAVSYPVLQAYGSPFSHRGADFFALDFRMPEGTLVYAAREGTVLRIEGGHTVSCFDDACDALANFVEIRHPDGTIGKYYHLQAGSVLVAPGEHVTRGEPIARSGDTGLSTAPHLHFGVYLPQADGQAQSIAVRFAVRGGMIGEPRAGARYLNQAD